MAAEKYRKKSAIKKEKPTEYSLPCALLFSAYLNFPGKDK